jgi:pimeloyl-ACP methyl ester carboxylesterase
VPPEPDPLFEVGDPLISPAPSGLDFYQPPSPLPGRNGDVIWAKQIASVANGRIWQVLYRSQSTNGEPIAVSGWLGVPNSRRPSDGFPLLAFGHGTTGLGDQCAPTRRSNPPETIALLEDFLARGYAVAATDYQGLGTPGLHQYLVGPSQSYSLLDSARAAQRFAGAGSRLILFGHSQGGHAVILASETAPSYAPELNVLGTIGSGSGVIDESGAILTALKRSFYKGYVVMTAWAQRAAYGGDNPVPGDGAAPLSLWLTEYGIQISQAIDTQCVSEIIDDYSGVDGSLLFVPGAPLPKVGVDVDYADSIPGLKSGASPLLMIHGRRDDQIPPAGVILWVEETCANPDVEMAIQLEWFDTGHRVPYEDPKGAADVIFPWIDARFAGSPARSSCGNVPRP